MTFRSFHIVVLTLTCALLCLCQVETNGQSDAPSEEQKNFYIKSIFFGGGSDYVDPGQHQELLDFIMDIDDLREYEIVLHGHTDNIGSKIFNQQLSERRSISVLEILAELDLTDSGIQVHDFGEDSPYYDNMTWEGKLSNRRVDVIIQKIVM